MFQRGDTNRQVSQWSHNLQKCSKGDKEWHISHEAYEKKKSPSPRGQTNDQDLTISIHETPVSSVFYHFPVVNTCQRTWNKKKAYFKSSFKQFCLALYEMWNFGETTARGESYLIHRYVCLTTRHRHFKHNNSKNGVIQSWWMFQWNLWWDEWGSKWVELLFPSMMVHMPQGHKACLCILQTRQTQSSSRVVGRVGDCSEVTST